MTLHDQILALPCEHGYSGLSDACKAYEDAHEDARQAAAELVLKADTRIKQLEDALKSSCSLLWMAHEYAIAGGSTGPEMRDYENAAKIFRPVLESLEK